MGKNNPFKIIFGIVVLILAIGIFGLQKFFPASQKEIKMNDSEIKDDILTDSPLENQKEEISPESEKNTGKTEEKSKVETKKEPTSAPEPSKSPDSNSLKIVDKLLSSGFQAASGRTIDTIVIHSSYDAIGGDPYSVNGIISEYKNYGVSAHYLIDRGGAIYRLVEEKNIAYHAGTSRLPDGRTNVNEISIGIELINTKNSNFTNEQYASLQSLIESIKGRYEIKYILGHNQIAPGRKDDPWNFNWGKIK
jgi:hypothetical protein